MQFIRKFMNVLFSQIWNVLSQLIVSRNWLELPVYVVFHPQWLKF
uniref:Uncharacterized protein n=1 Tax=Setaria italica TaxID=4555 RepID=K4API7_SETIT